MSTFVLIHGAWHGGWCWDKVVPLLQQAGHRVTAPDLPGHGADRTPIPQVTLQAYAERTAEVLDAQPEPALLVGHSLGGAVITQAAELRPEKIRALVYLTGMLPQNGQSIGDLRDPDGLISHNRILADDKLSALVRDEAIAEIFYGDCTPQDVAWAKSLLVPQAVEPTMAPLRTSAERFGSVPRIYIECLQDKAISPARQREMYTALPCQAVLSLDTSHSPFFSAPEALAAHLQHAAELV